MLLDYGEFAGLSARNQPVKRNYDQREQDPLPQPCPKRLKGELTNDWWQLKEDAVPKERTEDLGFLTPAATPAEGGFTVTQQKASSPYSEAEDYMVQGYYQDNLLAYERRPCVESLQYNLYDTTPEEFELIDDEDEHENETRMDNAYISWQPATNDTVNDESYDIDM